MQPCGDCDENAADSFCVDCALMLCAGCTKDHLKRKSTRNHTVQTLADLSKQGASVVAAKTAGGRATYCATHTAPNPFHELTLYCKTCKEAICRDCIVIDHKAPDHDFVFLEQIVADQRAEVGALVQQVQVHHAASEAVVVLIDMEDAEVTARQATAAAEVKRRRLSTCCARFALFGPALARPSRGWQRPGVRGIIRHQHHCRQHQHCRCRLQSCCRHTRVPPSHHHQRCFGCPSSAPTTPTPDPHDF